MKEIEKLSGRDPGYRSTRVLVPMLLVAIIGLSLMYAWVSFGTTREMRIQSALEGNLTMSQLSARLLDEQCEDVVTVLNELAQSAALHSTLASGNRAALRNSLHFDVDLVPELLFLALYGPDGKLIEQYPAAPAAPTTTAHTEWADYFRAGRTLYIGKVMTLPHDPKTEVMVAARPWGDPARPGGYILAYYRLGRVNEWMQQLHIGDGTLYILDVTGRVVSMTGNTHNHLTGLNPDLPSYLAGQRGRGTLIARSTQGDRVLVGFAFAAKPHWHVLVLRNEETALNLTNYLFHRLSLLLIPLLALLLAAGWMLIGLFQRREQMARQLAVQNERLLAADRAKSDFLANMSHELRTPLANMQISLSGLLDPDLIWEKAQAQECLQLASEELDLLIARIRNLLDMSRIEAHANAIHKEPNDLTDIVGSALERLRSLLRGRPLRADFPTEPLLAECDYAQIETVVVNLVENALKYSPAGTPLDLKGQREDATVRLIVRNAGGGIPPGEQAHIFEKFYRASASPAIGGTGLGLAICKAIVEAHDGTIGVQNVRGGIEFWLTLPAAPVLSEVHQ
ncbi:MAG TPA: ATP-binding protein [Chthonomonadaceae bacterium]|nr:ATP-binding protein [Chthonomonadaceae bacterium]